MRELVKEDFLFEEKSGSGTWRSIFLKSKEKLISANHSDLPEDEVISIAREFIDCVEATPTFNGVWPRL